MFASLSPFIFRILQCVPAWLCVLPFKLRVRLVQGTGRDEPGSDAVWLGGSWSGIIPPVEYPRNIPVKLGRARPRKFAGQSHPTFAAVTFRFPRVLDMADRVAGGCGRTGDEQELHGRRDPWCD